MFSTVPVRIEGFEGGYRWLSNFAPALIAYEDVVYPTVEHAYQAAKTVDRRQRLRVCGMPTPGGAKHAGKSVTLRPNWDDIKRTVMLDLLRLKFSLRTYRTLLLQTGDAVLVETNWWGDRYWGVCRGAGENHLGLLLMAVRDELRKG